MKNIIFHVPFFVDKNRISGSHLRPMRMIQGFESIGYNVHVVKGYAAERKESIEKIKRLIDDGTVFEFCYSESSTMPTMLTEKNHLPKYPSIDFGFFDYLNKKNIPIGLFYRDCYWLFSQYKETVGKLKQLVSVYYYKKDLKLYNKYVQQMYLPRIKMNDYLPTRLKNVKPLPPGIDKVENRSIPQNDKLRLFYVGGLSALYSLELLVKTIKELDFVEFTLCTRKDEWENNKQFYKDHLTDRVQIVHKGVGEYESDMKNAHIAVLYVKPDEYWTFSMPVKMFEYLKYQKPILATKGTSMGDFVLENNIGFTVEHDEKSLKELLTHVYNNMDVLEELSHDVNKTAFDNTWEMRARQVAKDLGGKI